MAEIKLTPTGQLRWIEQEKPTASASLAAVQSAFERNWTEGLFVLAAEKIETAGLQTLRYWQAIADHYLTGLCHSPEFAEMVTVELPGDGELSSWLLTAPPMVGGEYLSVATLAANPAKQLAQTDLAVTAYSMLARQDWLTQVNWKLAILDEAQAIKNPSTAKSKAVKRLNAQARIVLTGAPVENRLGDLWSLFDFINPGLLGSVTVFKTFIKEMESRQADQFGPLRRLVSPYILRRMKTDRTIIADLPEKIKTSSYCKLSKAHIYPFDNVYKSFLSNIILFFWMAYILSKRPK